MQERNHKKVDTSTTAERQDTRQSAASLAERGQDLQEKIDDLLDEIDEVLEKNAEEFVAGYVQRGGE